MTNIAELLRESLADPIEQHKAAARAAIVESKRQHVLALLRGIPSPLMEYVQQHTFADTVGHLWIDIPGHHRIRPTSGGNFDVFKKGLFGWYDSGPRYGTFGAALLAADKGGRK